MSPPEEPDYPGYEVTVTVQFRHGGQIQVGDEFGFDPLDYAEPWVGDADTEFNRWYDAMPDIVESTILAVSVEVVFDFGGEDYEDDKKFTIEEW